MSKYQIEYHIHFKNFESNQENSSDIFIKDLAYKIANLSGYKGIIKWEGSKENDGMPRKVLDISKI